MCRHTTKSCRIAVALSVIFLFSGGICYAGAGDTYRILVINSYHPTYGWTKKVMDGIESTVAGYEGIINLDVEYMHTREDVDRRYLEGLYALYKHKAGRKKYDVIITSDNNALLFLLKHRDKLYPNVPVVFCGINGFEESMLQGHKLITGVTEEEIVEPTIEVALKLHPSIKQLVVVVYGAEEEFEEMEAIEEKLLKKGRLTKLTAIGIFEIITKEGMIKKMAEFWDKSIVVFIPPFRAPRENVFSFEDVAPLIRQQFNTPMYCLEEEWFDQCPIVGGKINSGFGQGRAAAEMAIRILEGESPQNIPVKRSGVDTYIFDYLQLKHFGIPLSKLPGQSTILNEPKSFYYIYKKYIWSISAIILTLLGIVISLHLNIIRRKKVGKKLLDYQLRLKSMTSELSLAEERQRHRIATVLHDHISQSLVIAKLKLETLREAGLTGNFTDSFNEVCDLLDKTLQDAKSLTFELSSPVLHELGLEAAIADWLSEYVEQKYGISTEFEDDGRPKPLEKDVYTLLFRNVQEILNNVIKHSHAKKVQVNSQKVNSQLQISIEDDGVGFDVVDSILKPGRTGGFGLFGIKERLEQIGGSLEVLSQPGCGTQITLIVPLKAD